MTYRAIGPLVEMIISVVEKNNLLLYKCRIIQIYGTECELENIYFPRYLQASVAWGLSVCSKDKTNAHNMNH